MIKISLLYFTLFIGFLGITPYLSAQQYANLHIVTDKNNQMSGFASFHFTINGQPYKLKAGECLEKTIQADSIHILVEDKRWVKQKRDDLHVVATADMYIWILLKYNGKLKDPFYAAEIICKSCFEEMKEKCRKTITE